MVLVERWCRSSGTAIVCTRTCPSPAWAFPAATAERITLPNLHKLCGEGCSHVVGVGEKPWFLRFDLMGEGFSSLPSD